MRMNLYLAYALGILLVLPDVFEAALESMGNMESKASLNVPLSAILQPNPIRLFEKGQPQQPELDYYDAARLEDQQEQMMRQWQLQNGFQLARASNINPSKVSTPNSPSSPSVFRQQQQKPEPFLVDRDTAYDDQAPAILDSNATAPGSTISGDMKGVRGTQKSELETPVPVPSPPMVSSSSPSSQSPPSPSKSGTGKEPKRDLSPILHFSPSLWSETGVVGEVVDAETPIKQRTTMAERPLSTTSMKPIVEPATVSVSVAPKQIQMASLAPFVLEDEVIDSGINSTVPVLPEITSTIAPKLDGKGSENKDGVNKEEEVELEMPVPAESPRFPRIRTLSQWD